jgi:hypothetical protein
MVTSPDHNPPTPEDGWLTERDAAYRLGIGISTVKHLVYIGKLPIIHRHKRGGIRVEDVDILLLGARIKPGTTLSSKRCCADPLTPRLRVSPRKTSSQK